MQVRSSGYAGSHPILSGAFGSSGVTVGSDVTVRSGSNAGKEAAAYPARGAAGSSGGVTVGSAAIARGSDATDRGSDAGVSIDMPYVASWTATGRAHSLASVPKRPKPARLSAMRTTRVFKERS
jgi:hypothetical protein